MNPYPTYYYGCPIVQPRLLSHAHTVTSPQVAIFPGNGGTVVQVPQRVCFNQPPPPLPHSFLPPPIIINPNPVNSRPACPLPTERTKYINFNSIRKEDTKWTPPLVETKTTIVTTPHDLSDDAEITLSCPMCWERYSSDRFPFMLTKCGHSLCRICYEHGIPCVTCGLPIRRRQDGRVQKTPGKKNYALLDLVNLHHATQAKLAVEKWKFEKMERQTVKELAELRTFKVQQEKKEAERQQAHIKCSRCGTTEKRERMCICQTCAGIGDLDWTGVGEEEVLPHLLCAFCGYCREEHTGHSRRNYVDWKIKRLFSTTISSGQEMVASMDEVSAHEIEKGKGKLKRWNEAVMFFDSIGAHVTYEDGVQLGNALQKEAEAVCEASERTLFPFRRYTKILTVGSEDSTSRLEQWSGALKERKRVTIGAGGEETAADNIAGNNSWPSCYKCGKDDHASASCPNGFVPRCDHCKQKSHPSKDCPNGADRF